MTVKWEGVYPAVTTKFTADDQLDLSVFGHNLQAQIDAGVEGIVLCGSLGEASTLSNAEKLRLLTYSLSEFGGQLPIILNIAERRTSEAIAMVQQAEKLGAHGFMLLPPMQYKAGDAEVVTFFKTIAQSTSRPIMVYNNPVDYKIMVSVPMLEELLKLDNIQAIKESTRDITNITRMRNAFGGRLKILGGVDTLAFESLAAGADGWVAGLVNAFPRETVLIYQLTKAGRLQEALDIYRWFMPLLELDIHPKLVQYIKLAEVATGLGTEAVRPPRLPLSGAERQRVLAIIEKGVAKRPDLAGFVESDLTFGDSSTP